MTASTLTITRPDDWHLHLRDGDAMRSVVGATARVFGRAVVMPNLEPPVTTVAAAAAYRERIVGGAAGGLAFRAAADALPHRQHAAARDRGCAQERLRHRRQVLSGRRDDQFGLRRHRARPRVPGAGGDGETRRCRCWCTARSTGADVDMFDRERVFVEQTLARIVRDFPGTQGRARARHDARSGGFRRRGAGARRRDDHAAASRCTRATRCSPAALRPHLYCLPVLKRETHRQALVAAATVGNPKFFLGTDSAPHARHAKESRVRLRRLLHRAAALELYAEAFEGAGALDGSRRSRASTAPDFYGLPRNARHGDARARAWTVPGGVSVRRGGARCRSAPGETLHWRVDFVSATACYHRASEAGQTVAAGRASRPMPTEESPGSAERDAG